VGNLGVTADQQADPLPAGGVVVRIAGEGRWLVPQPAEERLQRLDHAVTRAVDDLRDDEYTRLLGDLCRFVRRRGTLLDDADRAGGADVTVPPPGLSLAGAIDELYDAGGFAAEPRAA
jgi:hypothetical protein